MVSNTHFLHYIKFPKNTFPIQFFENYLHCFERKKKNINALTKYVIYEFLIFYELLCCL